MARTPHSTNISLGHLKCQPRTPSSSAHLEHLVGSLANDVNACDTLCRSNAYELHACSVVRRLGLVHEPEEHGREPRLEDLRDSSAATNVNECKAVAAAMSSPSQPHRQTRHEQQPLRVPQFQLQVETGRTVPGNFKAAS